MGQPVKLSDSLVQDARLIGQLTKRSMAGQIEFWAAIGRAIEPLIAGVQAMALTRASTAVPLSECLHWATLPEGRERLANYFEGEPFPHYAAAPGRPGLLVRTEADGKRTLGRFVRRQFRPIESSGE
jgi:hypothetical protein